MNGVNHSGHELLVVHKNNHVKDNGVDTNKNKYVKDNGVDIITSCEKPVHNNSVPQRLSGVKCTDHVVTNDIENLVHNNDTFTGTNSLNGGSQSNNICDKNVKLFDINSHSDDKYINNLLLKSVVKRLTSNIHLQCDAFKQWKSQTDFDFGFIPLADLVLSE